MAYSEKDLQNGIIERKYFGLDSSRIFKMYYNDEIIKFPKQKITMGKNSKVVLSIDMCKFKGLFHLFKGYIRLKFSTAFLKYPIFVFQNKSIKGESFKYLGQMKKDTDGYYKFDITDILEKHLNSKLFLKIETKNHIDMYTLFAFYGLKAEFVIEYYDPNLLYISNEVKKTKIDKKTYFNYNDFIKKGILVSRLLSVGNLLDLKLVFSNFLSEKFIFNFNEKVYGGVNNYKYVDERGVVHSFRLNNNTFSEYHEIGDSELILLSNADYTFTVIGHDEKRIFNREGMLLEIHKRKGFVRILYNTDNLIAGVTDNRGNAIYFEYEKDKMIIRNSKNKNIIKILNCDGKVIVFDDSKTEYEFNIFNQVICIKKKEQKFIFAYDRIGRIKDTFKEIL